MTLFSLTVCYNFFVSEKRELVKTETVYVDILFFVNFAMDFLALYLCAKLRFLRPKTFRLLTAALFAALYGVLRGIFDFWGPLWLLSDIAACFLCTLIAFYEKSLKKTILLSAIYYVISLLLGGIVFSAYTLALRWGSQKNVIAFVIISVVFCILLLLLLRREKPKKRAKVTVAFQNKRVFLDCFFDSGNLLRDPFTGTPVIIVKFQKLCELIGYENAKLLDEEKICDLPEHLQKRIRLIPAKTVIDKAILPGICPDSVIVDTAPVDALIVPVSDDMKINSDCDGILPGVIM